MPEKKTDNPVVPKTKLTCKTEKQSEVPPSKKRESDGTIKALDWRVEIKAHLYRCTVFSKNDDIPTL